MVPARQCSAKKSRRISTTCAAGIIGASAAQGAGRLRGPHQRPRGAWPRPSGGTGPGAHRRSSGAPDQDGERGSLAHRPSRLAAAAALHGQRGRARREGATGRGTRGSLMRHARLAPGPVGPLAIAVIESAFRALLVAVSGGAERAGAACIPTGEATVRMAAITRRTEEEELPAPPAGPHPEDLHGPVGPERSGRQWTRPRECATTRASRPRLPWGGCARGPGGCVSGPSPSHLRGRGTLPKTDRSATLYSAGCSDLSIFR